MSDESDPFVAKAGEVVTIKGRFGPLAPPRLRLTTDLFDHPVDYMPVPRCDTCQHWRQRTGKDDGVCLLAGASGSKIAAELYDAVITEADFGCVQWEAKP